MVAADVAEVSRSFWSDADSSVMGEIGGELVASESDEELSVHGASVGAGTWAFGVRPLALLFWA